MTAAVSSAALASCSFENVVPEYPTKKVLFTYQQYNRQVVVGEGLGIEVGFVFAGLPASDRDRVVKFEIDPTLMTNEKQSLLPAEYYTLAQENQTVIKKGSLKSYVPLALDSAAFVNDPKALTGEYVLPVRIVEADADEIAEGKDYTLISLSYQGRQYGNYTYFGIAASNTVEQEKKYMNQPSVTASVRQLQTIGPDKFRVYADQTSVYTSLLDPALKEPGENTFELVSKYVDDIALVTEDEISGAILALIEKQKMIAEGAGAVSVAAAMFNKFPIKGKKVVSLVSGGNIDVTSLSRVIKRGLMKSGRATSLLIELIDKPGQLKDVSRIIADCGGNVTSVHHERAGSTESVNGCYLRIAMETRNYDHVMEIKQALQKEGFKIVKH